MAFVSLMTKAGRILPARHIDNALDLLQGPGLLVPDHSHLLDDGVAGRKKNEKQPRQRRQPFIPGKYANRNDCPNRAGKGDQKQAQGKKPRVVFRTG